MSAQRRLDSDLEYDHSDPTAADRQTVGGVPFSEDSVAPAAAVHRSTKAVPRQEGPPPSLPCCGGRSQLIGA
eukprot:SAG11_NODE_12469_length_701_cov_1.451827_1_plen_71_part_10